MVGVGSARRSAEPVRVHDFIIPELGRAAPYGVYDIADNAGWVSVGIDNDTASSQSIPSTLVEDDGTRALPARGETPNYRRLQQQQRGACPSVEAELQALADELGLAITVCHLPPGTSKWNESSIACSRSSRRTRVENRPSFSRPSFS